MTIMLPAQQIDAHLTTERTARPRHFLMCRPEHFAVAYAINPWMDPTAPVDVAKALDQWETLRETYEGLGHRVELIDPLPELPDMVFAANGGTVVGGRALAASFTFAERQPEGAAYAQWLTAAGLGPVETSTGSNEGEGDFTLVGDVLLAGTGFRTERSAHAQAQELFGVPVVSLQLIDPRYYHLDTALFALDDHNVAYYPGAFSPGSLAALQRLYPDAVLASADDAAVLGLNAVSDGRHVVLAHTAERLAEQVASRGYVPVPVDLSELLKAGGGAKCCTLEVRKAP